MNKVIIILLLLGFSGAAVFNRVNTVINAPVVRGGLLGQITMGASGAPYLEGTNTAWEDDYFINYQMTDVLQVGMTRTHAASTVGNMQLIVAKDVIPRTDIAMGIEQITGREKDSTIGGLTENATNAMSAYVAVSTHQLPWEYTLGVGTGRLPVFFSVSYYLSNDIRTSGRCSFEYDGRDYNLGVRLPVNESLAFNIALTQLPARTGSNPAYGPNVPYQTLSFGVDYSFNLFSFYSSELSRLANKFREIDDKSLYFKEKLNLMMSNADQSDQLLTEMKDRKTSMGLEFAKAIDELKKQKTQMKSDIKLLRDLIVSDGFRGVNTLKEDVLNYYYKALQYYYDEKYPEAIGELSKANLINNNIPEIHLRMGSIYWAMGLKTEAISSWHRSYDLDKKNDELNAFLKDHRIDISGWMQD